MLRHLSKAITKTSSPVHSLQRRNVINVLDRDIDVISGLTPDQQEVRVKY